MARCPCSHEYCRDCLSELFSASITDESLFLPHCCKQPIPVEPNKTLLSPEIVMEFQSKEIEYGTANQTYCHKATCSAFIPLACIAGDTAICTKCATRTCAVCKGVPHSNECPDDAATTEVLRIASENGWQRCGTCRRMVELQTGCNHITCVCGAEFCYVCGAQWKNCSCAMWHENRLLSRANVIVDRDNRGEAMDEERRRDLVERERRNLVENHECTHDRWKARGGGHQCEECYDVMPQFIDEYRQCRILACRRCRYSQL